MPTLLIADDHPLFRAALHRAAEEAVADLQICEADSLDSVLDALEGQSIDLMLLDLHMPGNHGLAGLATIRALQPGLAIIIVSANEEPQVIRRAIDLGAAGYLPKSSGLHELQAALQSVLEGERWIPALLREPVARVAPFSRDADLAARLASLSAHQYKVLGLVAEGLLNKQIADRLGVQLRTVKAHMTRIMGRLGCATARRPSAYCTKWDWPIHPGRSKKRPGPDGSGRGRRARGQQVVDRPAKCQRLERLAQQREPRATNCIARRAAGVRTEDHRRPQPMHGRQSLPQRDTGIAVIQVIVEQPQRGLMC